MNVRDRCELDKESIVKLAGKVLRRGYKLKTKTSGASMFPVVRKGDIVTIEPVYPERIKIGEVIAFKKENCPEIVLHRVLYKYKDYFLTRGDISINKSCDKPIKYYNILGSLKEIRRNGKIIKLGGKFNKIHNRIIVSLSRYFPITLFIPAIIVRICITPGLCIEKTTHWFKKLFLSKFNN